MPGVTVTATSQQTQQAVSATTDDSGFYTFPNLTPGRYNMSAELQGFKKINRNDVQLDAAGSINIDFDLQTGELTEEVTVTAEAAPLQTDVALRKTVESKDIEQMSFSGRNPIGVAGLKAGVVGGSFNSYGFASLSNGGYNINGSRGDENNITVDGATAIRTRSAGAAIGVQNVDAIQEVQVLTGNYMPEFGRACGRSDPHGHQVAAATATPAARRTSSATSRSRPTAGRATGARARSRTAARRRSTSSSTAIRSAVPSPARCSRTSCSSSARRSG